MSTGSADFSRLLSAQLAQYSVGLLDSRVRFEGVLESWLGCDKTLVVDLSESPDKRGKVDVSLGGLTGATAATPQAHGLRRYSGCQSS